VWRIHRYLSCRFLLCGFGFVSSLAPFPWNIVLLSKYGSAVWFLLCLGLLKGRQMSVLLLFAVFIVVGAVAQITLDPRQPT